MSSRLKQADVLKPVLMVAPEKEAGHRVRTELLLIHEGRVLRTSEQTEQTEQGLQTNTGPHKPSPQQDHVTKLMTSGQDRHRDRKLVWVPVLVLVLILALVSVLIQELVLDNTGLFVVGLPL